MSARLIRCFAALATALGLLTSPLAAESGAQWGYHGDLDPAHWGDIAPTCKSGRTQSPVDIRTADVQKRPLPPIEFHYSPSVLRLSNNGHTVQADYDKGSYIQVGDRRYDLVQFHFHTPAEEEVDGKESDLVAHLVHASANGELAVVAILFERGADNPVLARFWGQLPGAAGESRVLSRKLIQVSELLPQKRSYYTVTGSLTTPPCSENVRWLILKNPVPVSQAQVAAFRRIYPMNNRPVQPLNGRVVQATSD